MFWLKALKELICGANITFQSEMCYSTQISSFSLPKKWSDTIGLVIQSPSHPALPEPSGTVIGTLMREKLFQPEGIKIDSKLLSQWILIGSKKQKKSNSSCYLVKGSKEKFQSASQPKATDLEVQKRKGSCRSSCHLEWKLL